MSEDTPIDRKKRLESWLRVADQELAKLREIRSFEPIRHTDIRDCTHRNTLQIQPSRDALKVFLIADLERQIALRKNELRRTRFEAAEYLRATLAATEAEIHAAAQDYFQGKEPKS
jgi:uncharacterized small protein (DUF1192 family)